MPASIYRIFYKNTIASSLGEKMYNREDLKELLRQKLTGLIAPEENERIERLLKEDPEAKAWFDREGNRCQDDYFSEAKDASWRRIQGALFRRRRSMVVGMAAALLIALFFSFWLAPEQPITGVERAVVHSSPQKEGGVTLFCNGRKVNLEMQPASTVRRMVGTGLYQHRDTLEVLQAAHSLPQWHVLRVSAGHQYTLVLDDGSVVRMEGLSTLKFPSALEKSIKREVYLEGKATFQIAPKRESPFTVHTENVQVAVLGTIFNVNASQGHFSANLKAGKIKVYTDHQELVLAPGQKVKLDLSTNRLFIERPLPVREPAVPMADFQVVDYNLPQIGVLMERIYGVKTVFSADSRHRAIHGSIILGRAIPLSRVLEDLQEVDHKFSYRMSGDTVYIR